MNLKDAVAIITGGGSGLGEATAREFADGGAKIVILDLPASPGAKVAESFGNNGLFVAMTLFQRLESRTRSRGRLSASARFISPSTVPELAVPTEQSQRKERIRSTSLTRSSRSIWLEPSM
jgi:hypothetical protein